MCGRVYVWSCRFRVRADTQHPVSGRVRRPTRPHGRLHCYHQHTQLGRLHHVWQSASHPARLARVTPIYTTNQSINQLEIISVAKVT